MRFLIIDDDPKSSLRLKRFLEEEAFVVDHATDANRGLFLAKINEYDFLIINQTGPGEFGEKLCSDLRATDRNLGIIGLLSSGGLQQRLKFFLAGADDCLSQPFAYREIIARIRAILRRGNFIKTEIFTASGIVLNSRTQRARFEKKALLLSKKEFALLELLMRSKGEVVSKSVILEHVWDMNVNPFSTSVEAHIFTLRAKLGKRGRLIIRNVQGRGYFIEE